VDVSVFDKFDYVALGHIHGPQRVGRDTVRYSGSMLKYSFSEQYHQKGALLIRLKQKGEVEIDKLPFDMPTEMATLQGKMQDILDNATPGDTRYLQVVLTDDTPLYNAIGTLKAVYPNLLALKFAPGSAVAVDSRTAAKNVARKTPMQLFEDLFAMQNGMEMSEYQQDLINKMWEDEA
ncbi:MAG: exonuclease SbcCD subunit D C-terminal domain-containing protein, partial [Oscillospiraceae bacterium]|nr:exonuclease SbcCD subunit D C-terminal domain-containing protein [Oscillospiraceae bacterium]